MTSVHGDDALRYLSSCQLSKLLRSMRDCVCHLGDTLDKESRSNRSQERLQLYDQLSKERMCVNGRVGREETT